MKRWMLLFSLCLACTTLFAQGGSLSKAGQHLTGKRPVPPKVSIKTGTPRLQTTSGTVASGIERQIIRETAVPSPRTTPAAQQFTQMEKMVHIPTYSGGTIPRKNWLPQDRGDEYIDKTNYQQALEEFEQLKKDATALLYYQAKPSERRELSPQEARYYIDRVNRVRQKLAAMRARGVTTDQSVQNAYAFLNYLMETVSPGSVPFSPSDSFQIPERVFNEEEFFLQDPLPSNYFKRVLANMGIYGEDLPALPENLKVVIFNDSSDTIAKLDAAQENGRLFPQGNDIHFFNKMEDVLQHIITQCNFPDIVITDLTTYKGLEGALLAQNLRMGGYKGGIIALAGYSTSEVDTDALLRAGFDGMIAWPIQGSFTKRITKSVQNYFYYRDLHQWTR